MCIRLATITDSNRGHRHFQTSWRNLSSSTAMRGSQKPWAHLCWCDVFCKLFSMCAHKLKSRGFKSGLWVPKFHVDVQPVQHSLCRVYRSSVLLENVIRFLSDLLAPWKISFPKFLCKRPRLTCSSVQTKPEASFPRTMLRRQASWLKLDA